MQLIRFGIGKWDYYVELFRVITSSKEIVQSGLANCARKITQYQINGLQLDAFCP